MGLISIIGSTLSYHRRVPLMSRVRYSGLIPCGAHELVRPLDRDDTLQYKCYRDISSYTGICIIMCKISQIYCIVIIRVKRNMVIIYKLLRAIYNYVI